MLHGGQAVVTRDNKINITHASKGYPCIQAFQRDLIWEGRYYNPLRVNVPQILTLKHTNYTMHQDSGNIMPLHTEFVCQY